MLRRSCWRCEISSDRWQVCDHFPPLPAGCRVEKEEHMLWKSEDGQGTIEYVLVILAAAAIALALIAWIGGTDLIGMFFSGILDKVIGFIG